ncbi:AzlC family protein [Streptococcus pneumoniae]|nr:AzlC family protein [Streptococcus pneumoniae]
MPTALGYVSIGLACGTIGAPYVTPVEMGLMSLFVYAGSAQFAMLALIVVQAPVAAIAMTVFLIQLASLFVEFTRIDLFPSYQSLVQYRYV